MVFLSCREHNTTHTILTQAEDLMNSNPREAYDLLKQADSTVNFNRGQRAVYNLLITQAMDKAYVPHKTDSLVQVAADYFHKTKDAERLMQSYYYQARIWQDLGDSPRAQDFYFKALAIGKEIGSEKWMGMIHNNLGYLYLMQDDPQLAINQFDNAVSNYQILNDTIRIAQIQRNIGRAYNYLEKTDSALLFYQKALPLFPTDKKAILKNEIGDLYLNKKDYATAFSYINDAIESAPLSLDKTPFYLTLGDLYIQWGKLDSATFYLEKSANSEILRTKSSSYYFLYHIAQKEKRWEDFAVLQKEYEELRDSITKQINTETVHKMQSLYNYQQAVNERNIYLLQLVKKERNIYAFLLLSLALLFVVILFIVKLRNEKWKKEAIKTLFHQLSDRQKDTSLAQFKSNKERIDEISKGLLFLSNDKKKEVLIVEKEYLEKENSKIAVEIKEKNELIRKNDIRKMYLQLHEELVTSITPAFRERLIKAVLCDSPEFEHLIKIKQPDLELIDWDICFLTKAGFSPGRISELLNIKPSNLSMRKKRLYEKICEKKCAGKDFEILIHSL